MKDVRTEELKAIYSPEGSPLRNFQLDLLQIMIEIDKVCSKNNIKYSLAAGTLLGAYRHEGFIPWDDDVDFMMTRNEYQKLLMLCDKSGRIKDSFLSLGYRTHPTFEFDNKIVDLFVEDNCPKSSVKRFVKMSLAKLICLGIKCRYRIDLHNYFKPFKLWCCLIPLVMFIKLKTLQEWHKKVCIWWNDSSSDSVACFGDSLKDIHHQYPKTMYDEYIETVYEGYDFFTVKDYEIQLKELYGDWRQIPPVNKRVWLARVQSDVKIKRK